MIVIYAKDIEGVWFGLAFKGEEIFATTFAFNEKEVLRNLLVAIPFNIAFHQLDKPSAFAERVIAVLKDIYDGKDTQTNFSLATRHLPNSTRRVIEVTRLIPTGYVSSYGAIANVVGGSPRSVGNVMAVNPFAPLVPCHRVVRSDFTLGGYAGGLNLKLQILEREKRGFVSKREIPVDGRKLLVFPVEFVLKKLEI
ncbi:MAG: methylated-DNA--[protein]-cysteine S-methyltransferase [Candidatus Bathyarchaeia archaeon]